VGRIALKSILGWVLALIGAIVVGLALTHVFVSPVNPRQPAPENHIGGPCWACHIVSESAKIRELE